MRKFINNFKKPGFGPILDHLVKKTFFSKKSVFVTFITKKIKKNAPRSSWEKRIIDRLTDKRTDKRDQFYGPILVDPGETYQEFWNHKLKAQRQIWDILQE